MSGLTNPILMFRSFIAEATACWRMVVQVDHNREDAEQLFTSPRLS